MYSEETNSGERARIEEKTIPTERAIWYEKPKMCERLTLKDAIAKANEAEVLCLDAVYHSGWLWEDLLDQWTINVLALKSVGNGYPGDKLNSLLERCNEIERMEDPGIDLMVEHAVKMTMVERLLIPIGR